MPIKTTFCDIDTVACVSGLTNEQVYERVESGDLLWVWNVSSTLRLKRELRFWSREINDPASVARLTIDDVIKIILPDRSQVPGQRNGILNWEFRRLLRLSKSSLSNLRRELGVKNPGRGRNLFIARGIIEQFFRRRWLGTVSVRKGATRSKYIYEKQWKRPKAEVPSTAKIAN